MTALKWLFGAMLVLAGFVAATWITGHAQERPDRPTRQWRAATIDYTWGGQAQVDIVDTEGVCLYVIARAGQGGAIAAVPKTQLPPGTGCQ